MNEDRYMTVNQVVLNWYLMEIRAGITSATISIQRYDSDTGEVLLEYGLGDGAFIGCRNLISAYITGLYYIGTLLFLADI